MSVSGQADQNMLDQNQSMGEEALTAAIATAKAETLREDALIRSTNATIAIVNQQRAELCEEARLGPRGRAAAARCRALLAKRAQQQQQQQQWQDSQQLAVRAVRENTQQATQGQCRDQAWEPVAQAMAEVGSCALRSGIGGSLPDGMSIRSPRHAFVWRAVHTSMC